MVVVTVWIRTPYSVCDRMAPDSSLFLCQAISQFKYQEKHLKQLFLSRLPRNTQVVLASAKDRENIEHLAELADNIAEVYAPAPTLASVSNPSIPLATQPLVSDPVAALLK